MEIVKSIEKSGLLIEGVTETIKNEAKEQKGRFLPMLLDTLAASLSGSVLSGKGVIRAGGGTIRAGQDFKQPHPLTNFEIQNNYQNKPQFNGVYSRNNSPKIKDQT